jgi:hypothetical protein
MMDVMIPLDVFIPMLCVMIQISVLMTGAALFLDVIRLSTIAMTMMLALMIPVVKILDAFILL